MPSIIDYLVEKGRQDLTGDKFFYKKLPWIFRLKVEGEQFVSSTGPDGEALFVLPVAPEQFNYDLPYALELTPQQQGGVVADEAGFVIGEITMQGTTGFKLRRQQTSTYGLVEPGFTGSLGAEGGVFQEISGQLAFWILASRCFEAYSQLKKDPDLGPKTHLEFHNMKEHLHLRVIPRKFTLTRSASKERVTYRYDISLAVIGPALELKYISPDDRDIFDKLKDTISQVRNGVQMLSATIDDLTAAVDELGRIVGNIAGIIDDIRSVVDAGQNFITGAKNFFNLPKRFMISTAELVESAANLFEDATNLPADIAQTMRSAADSIDQITLACRNHYVDNWRSSIVPYELASRVVKYGASQTEAIQALIESASLKGESAQGQMTLSEAFGDVRPGDKKRQQLEAIENRLKSRQYNGFTERIVGQGDTIQSLAAKYLGDARRWIDLAIINRLKAPYVVNQARIPNTVRVGDSIIVPIARPLPSPNVMSDGSLKKQGASQAAVHLGTDYLLELESDGAWGWAVDVSHGATDLKTVSEVQNLSQGLASRLRTIQGENIMFTSVGLPRLVGKTQMDDPTIEARFRVRQQILSDPRVERVNSFSFVQDRDSIKIVAEIQPVGFNTSKVISQVIR
jgi:hypothetical protein